MAEIGLSEVSRVAHPLAGLESSHGCHLLLGEREAKDVKVLPGAIRVQGLGDNGSTALHGPTEAHLGGGLLVTLSDGNDLRLEEGRHVGRGGAHLDVGHGTETAVSSHSNTKTLAHAHKVILRKVGVELDLEASRLDLGVSQDLVDHVGLNVRDTNVPDETLLVHGLHGSISLVVRDTVVGLHDTGLGVGPVSRVLDIEGNILDGNGPVDVIQVDVVEAEVVEGSLQSRLDVLGAVEGAPELGGDEEVSSSDNALIDGSLDTLANLNLIGVAGSRVKKTVASLDSIIGSIGSLVLGDLPEAETNHGHLVAGGESDVSGGLLNHCVYSSNLF